MRVAVTGHRRLYEREELVREQILRSLQELKNVECLISGMALGVDMVAAEVAMSLGIPLWAYIPCSNQTALWNAEDQRKWATLLEQAAKTVWVSKEPYTPYCMQARNVAMVDECDVLLAVWDKKRPRGGTQNCIRYARTTNKRILLINPWA